jgi:hypothetical protein
LAVSATALEISQEAAAGEDYAPAEGEEYAPVELAPQAELGVLDISPAADVISIEAPALAHAPAINADIAVAGESNVTAALDQAEANQAISDKIDGIMAKAGDDGEDSVLAATQGEMPNNYRPPPVQNQKPRERRERPNIFDHGLLKSMDLSFVGGDIANPRSKAAPVEKPKHGAPIGFLS